MYYYSVKCIVYTVYCAHIHAYMHTYIRTHIYIHIHTHRHIYTHTYTHINAYIHTHIHTPIHTHTLHTYTHTHTHTCTTYNELMISVKCKMICIPNTANYLPRFKKKHSIECNLHLRMISLVLSHTNLLEIGFTHACTMYILEYQ